MAKSTQKSLFLIFCAIFINFVTSEADISHLGCPKDYKICKNGYCYPNSKECNFIDDCGDNSDEESCPAKCDFVNDANDNLCGWSDTGFGSSPYFDLINASDISDANYPNYPKTDWLGRSVSDRIKYLILKPNLNSDNELPVELKSRTFSKSNDKCKFVFHIHTNDTFTKVRVLRGRCPGTSCVVSETIGKRGQFE